MPRAKKDISKDLMFQKIMPSADIAGRRDDTEADGADVSNEQSELSALLSASDFIALESEHSTSPQILPVKKQSASAVSALRHTSQVSQNNAQQMAARTIAFSNDGEGYLINTMEKLVFDNLESILSRFKCCKCDRCKKDILALTLNTLPPKYIVATKDNPPGPCRDPQVITEVTTALVRAVIKVKSEPRH